MSEESRLTELAMDCLKKIDHPLVSGRSGVVAEGLVAEVSMGMALQTTT